MKKALLASAAAAVLSASASYGAIVANVSDLGVPTDGVGLPAGYPVLDGYHAYLVTLVADAGQNITAVDFSAEGTAGKTLNGPFHQYWSMAKNAKTGAISVLSKSVSSTATANSTATPNFYDAYDSHFVFDPARINVGSNPDENNDASTAADGIGTSPFAPVYNLNTAAGTPNDGWGQGTTMVGAWGIQGQFQANSTPIAYLVVPDSAHLTAPIHLGDPQIAETNATMGVSIDIPAIPEPMSLSLVGLAGAGMLVRRRRA